MEEKEIKAYFRRFHRDYGLDKHPTCLICNKEIKDTEKVEASKTKYQIILVHKSCWKKEQKHG